MKKTIYFRVDADQGRHSGFGHLTRILQLYFFLKEKLSKKFNFIFLTKKNFFTIRFLKKRCKEKILFYSKENIKKIKFSSDDIFIIDTLGIEKNLAKIINKFNIKKKISFEEINTKIFNRGVIINGIYFAKKKILPQKKMKIYQGEKYIILNKRFKKKIFVKKNKKIKKVLIMSGGSDYKNFLFKIANYLKDEEKYKTSIVVGPGVKKTNKIFNINNSKIKKITGLNNLSSVINGSDICVCTGGTVMFESIASGKLPIVFENYGHQRYAIKYFNKKNAIINAGKPKNLTKKSLLTLLNHHDLIDKRKYFFNNSKLIDGKGLDRIKTIISNYLR